MEGSEKKAARFRALTHLEQGRHLFNARRYDEALKAFEKAISEDPSFLRAYTAQAHALAVLGRREEAIAICKDVIARDASFALAYTTLGTALSLAGNNAEAQKAYEQAVAIAPDEPLVHYNFACFWAIVGDERNCEKHLSLALKLDPQSKSTAAVDGDFAPYRDRQWFQDLVALTRL